MVSLEEQENVVFMNSQYEDNKELIDRLQTKLLDEVGALDLSIDDLKDTKEYLNDRVNLFHFLKECQFEFDKAHKMVLETTIWRVELGVAKLTYKTSTEFYNETKGAFSFFHGKDKTGRPVIFVRLSVFPREFRDPQEKLVQHIQRYACLVMEMGRKLLWDMTCESSQLVSQMTVLVNIQKAPMIPVDAELIKMIGLILDSRFPGMVSSVNVLNFGWMYQGIWTVVKYLLTEEAKKSIRFTSVKELQPLIDSDAILIEMGGDDPYTWSFSTDDVLQKYGTGHPIEIELPPSIEPPELPNTPPLSEKSRSNSMIDTEDDVFFDANDSLSTTPRTPPVSTPYLQPLSTVSTQPIATPPTLPIHHASIPISKHTTPTSLTSSTILPGTVDQTTDSYFGNLSSWVGLRMGSDFLTSFIDTKQGQHQRQKRIHSNVDSLLKENSSSTRDNSSSIIIVNSSQPSNASLRSSKPRVIFTTKWELWQRKFKKMTHRILRISLGQHGMIYWVLVYFFLRGPVESIVHKTLERTFTMSSKRIQTTTLGITAAVAAITSTSVFTIIEKLGSL